MLDELSQLPLRATVAFAVRCAKRVEVLRRLGDLLTEAYAAGLVVDPTVWHGWWRTHKADVAADTARAARAAATDVTRTGYTTAHARDAADCSLDIDFAGFAAALADAKKLRSLGLGRPGEPGEPIRWNDPRLGPLWPDGPPDWYVEAEKACRELEEKLRDLPDPNQAPLGPELVARLDSMDKLDRMWNDGKLDEYTGQYVISDGETIFAHGRNLLKVRERAEKKAAAKGVAPATLVDYFVPAATPKYLK